MSRQPVCPAAVFCSVSVQVKANKENQTCLFSLDYSKPDIFADSKHVFCFTSPLEAVSLCLLFSITANFKYSGHGVGCSQELDPLRRSSCCEYLCFVRAHSGPEGSSSSCFPVCTVTSDAA